jgi:hypothetical protein
MANHQVDLVKAAVTPSAYDVVIASEVILELLRTTGYQGTRGLFEPVEQRMASEPVPEVVRDIEGVTEADVRKVRAAATTMTALAELEATGAILPAGSPPYEHAGWRVPYSKGGLSTAYNVDGMFTHRVAAAYRPRLRDVRSPLIDSPGVFLAHLPPSMGAKVRRALEEAVRAYRDGLYFGTAVLVGVASEAAWGQLARTVQRATDNPQLKTLLDDPLASANAIQQKTMELIRSRKPRGVEYEALVPVERSYRDLRNYAVHRPDETFEETRVARPVVGLMLENTVDYFRRLYELNDILSSDRSEKPKPTA